MYNRQNLLFFTLLIFFGCANIGTSPKGGPEDKTPPVLDLNESTKNFQTNFKKQDINLYFDEYVELKDIFTQVIISPPLEKRWQLTKKLKSVKFEFGEGEVLREDATYTINFGEAIRDFTAGNPVPDLRYVFSTGNFIDSMEVTGLVVDAITGKPAEDILVMLYDNLSDTVVRTERPFYFSKTDKSGAYKVQNVKTDSFKIFALKDADLNYFFNQETELIGFPDSLFYLSKSKETIPPFSVFLERPALNLIPPNNKKYGFVNLGFNQEPFDVEVTHEDIGQNVFYQTDEDSIKVWYDQSDTSQWNIFIEQGNAFKDTFLISPSGRNNFITKDSLKRNNARISESINLNPTKPVKILFNHPITAIDSISILLLEDTTLNPVIPKFEISGLELLVSYRWKEATPYTLQILPTAITDFYGINNQDTIQQKYQVMELKNFGDINLKVLELNPQNNYVINLYFQNNTNLVESMLVTGQSVFEKYFKTVPAGQYVVEVITDKNGNGRWDSGNYDQKTQPEPFFTQELEKLRENWEVDAEISIKE